MTGPRHWVAVPTEIHFQNKLPRVDRENIDTMSFKSFLFEMILNTNNILFHLQ